MTLDREWKWASASTATACVLSAVLSNAVENPAPAAPQPRPAMIAELPAAGPHPSLGEEARVFDRLVGVWDAAYTFHGEDGSISHAAGELEFGWIIDGRAMQDVWISHPREGRAERSIGTSLRFFDGQTRKWRVVWVAPAVGLLVTLEGGAEGDRIVLRGRDADGGLLRWSFFEIRADSFSWHGEKSVDAGETWRLEEDHRMTRRPNS